MKTGSSILFLNVPLLGSIDAAHACAEAPQGATAVTRARSSKIIHPPRPYKTHSSSQITHGPSTYCTFPQVTRWRPYADSFLGQEWQAPCAPCPLSTDEIVLGGAVLNRIANLL